MLYVKSYLIRRRVRKFVC